MNYDTFADWEVNLFCNLSCSYCFFHQDGRQKDPEFLGHSIRKAIDTFNCSEKTWLVHMTGGEPFLHPEFLELCRGLTENHYISVNSNFSTPNVYDFVNEVPPTRVARVNASLHIDQRNDIAEFVKKVKYFQDRRFNIHVSQVMYPPVLGNFEETFRSLREDGIFVRPKVFRGFYGLKRYPQSYTQAERNLFMRYYEESQQRSDSTGGLDLDWLFSFEKYLLTGELCFSGIRCGAGKDYVYIRYNGDAVRCIGQTRIKLGNVYSGEMSLDREPRPCGATICSCPHYGLKYAEKDPSVAVFPFQGLSLLLGKKVIQIKESIAEAI